MKLLFVIAILITQAAFATSVSLKFTQTKNKTGKIAYAIFDNAQGFPDGKAYKTGFIPVTSSQDSASVLVDLPQGDYAISFFLDENGNNKLDVNILGIPKERFGFSNNPRILTGPPNFNACEINVNESNKNFEMKLIKLF